MIITIYGFDTDSARDSRHELTEVCRNAVANSLSVEADTLNVAYLGEIDSNAGWSRVSVPVLIVVDVFEERLNIDPELRHDLLARELVTQVTALEFVSRKKRVVQAVVRKSAAAVRSSDGPR